MRIDPQTSIFFYGSLKKDEYNYTRMFKYVGCHCKRIYNAVANGELYDLGAFPAARFDERSKEVIQGEVHVFDEAVFKTVLSFLDYLEGFTDDPKTDFYVRKVIPVTLENGREVFVQAYEFAKFSPSMKLLKVPGGLWQGRKAPASVEHSGGLFLYNQSSEK